VAELSDFQKQLLLGRGAGQKLFTQKEFDTELSLAKAEIMAVAIETSRQAVMIERQACAEMARDWNSNGAPRDGLYEAIMNRIPSQRQ
jgi:hypothetical protein